MQLQESEKTAKNISKTIGFYLSIFLFVVRFPKILGDLFLKTALLKIHLWYVSYYSPLFKLFMSYFLFLESNSLL